MRTSLVALTAIALTTIACTGATPKPRALPKPVPGVSELARVEAKPIRDDAFAQALVTVLRDGTPSPDRQGTLAGVVRRQLQHASERISLQRERGIASVYGAIYLIRLGELQPGFLDEESDRPLNLALDALSARGDEGRAAALFSLRRAALPEGSPARKDLDEHVASLESWRKDVSERPGLGGPAETTGKIQRRLTSRALLDPSVASLDEAADSVVRWVDAGLVFQQRFKQAPRMFPREEIREGFRSLTSGGVTMAAIFLRHGDAVGALEALSSTGVKRVTPDALVRRLKAAVDVGDAASWVSLVDELSGPARAEEDIDPDVLQAAIFGTAVEAYRRDPGSLVVAQQLSAGLMAFGMPEAMPLVLADAAAKHPEPAVLSPMLAAVGRSILRDEEDDLASARRTFAAASALLAVADTPALKGKLNPSPARLRLVGANLHCHAGDVGSARPLLEASLADEPSSEATRRLAEIERSAGDRTKAAERIKASLDLPEAKNDRALEIELRSTLSDILRESGQRDAARDELLRALRSASSVTSSLGENQSRFERAVARTLDRLGEDAAAARAFDRALAASSDDAQKSVTLLEAMMRAVLNADVFAARKYARKARELSIRNEDLVYAGVWLMLLERELKERPDGTAAEILINIPSGPRWFSKLAAWSQGKLSDADLTANARTFSQKVEADFYLTLAQRASGATGLESKLEGVARSGAFDLFEVQFARDLIAGASRKLTGALPTDINLPGLNHSAKPGKNPVKPPPLPPTKGPVKPVAPK